MYSRAVLSLVIAATAHAADAPPVTIFSHADPALRLVERSDSYEKGSRVRWVGKVALTGSLVVEFDRAPPGVEQLDVDGGVHFEPDAKSIAKLPSAINYYAGPAKLLWIGGSGRDVMTPLIGRAAFDRLVRGVPARFEYPATIVISDLVTEVECDRRHYTVTARSIHIRSADMLASAEAKNISC